MNTYKLSPSALKLSVECPRCFWLHHNKKIRRPGGPMASLPTGMDRILKEHFNNFRDREELPPELKDNGHTNELKLFGKNVEEKELLVLWQNNFKGMQWKDDKGNILKGALDNVLVKGKKLIVLDYKTRGYPLKEDTASLNQNQLDSYNYLLRKLGYETEDYGFLLFYMPKEVLEGGEVVFDTELVKMKTNPASAEKVWKNGLKLLEGDFPFASKDEKGKSCVWCDRY
jgi:hypothetical protein